MPHLALDRFRRCDFLRQGGRFLTQGWAGVDCCRPKSEELVASLMRRIEALEAENAELRRRLDLDSSDSSKPPSSDGLKKKPRVLRGLRTRTVIGANFGAERRG